jgi:hypothetical protein
MGISMCRILVAAMAFLLDTIISTNIFLGYSADPELLSQHFFQFGITDVKAISPLPSAAIKFGGSMPSVKILTMMERSISANIRFRNPLNGSLKVDSIPSPKPLMKN